jgi:hypothetical protein
MHASTLRLLFTDTSVCGLSDAESLYLFGSVLCLCHAGAVPLENYLGLLRKSQREEYEEAFKQAVGTKQAAKKVTGSAKKAGAPLQAKDDNRGDGGDISAAKGTPKEGSKTLKPSAQSMAEPKTGPKHQHAHHNHVAQGMGIVHTTANHPPLLHALPEEDEHATPGNVMLLVLKICDNMCCIETGCNFCGAGSDRNDWTEDELDAHYLSHCCMLAPCPSCAQVVEIAALTDHLLDECEFLEDYVACEVTGHAIPSAEFEAWQASEACVPPPDNYFYCPLCFVAVKDNTHDWKQHCLYDCEGNERIGLDEAHGDV